jgi:predicted alpha/beta hydrolase family esterase
MTNKQRQHWQHQKHRAERYARAYGAGSLKAQEIAEWAAERLGTNCRRAAP